MSKKIKIQVWTDLYYARFIAIWRPEESDDYVAPAIDSRSSQEINVPVLLVTSSTFQPRNEVMGYNPVAPTQHPMPADFLQQQIRHIAYMFANDFGTFKPSNNSIANSFLAKMTLNYSLVKEFDLNVSPAQGNISLKEFRDSLMAYSDEELKKIKIVTLGEDPQDVLNRGLSSYIYSPKDASGDQFISITKLMPMYPIDPYINNSFITPETIAAGSIPFTESSPLTQLGTQSSFNHFQNNLQEQKILQNLDNIIPPRS